MHSHHILCSDFLLPKMPPPEIGPVLGANVLLFSILVGTKSPFGAIALKNS